MVSPDRNVGIVFNGAIYNFPELRTELEAKGYSFKTQTDTEVLIHGYDAWGIDELVRRIRGMFAFGLWDERRSRLFLVRDRLGVKPLVYTLRNGVLAFGSTVRALRIAGFADAIDEAALAEYLEFGYVTDDRAIYRGLVKVPAATIVEWSAAQLIERTYWVPPTPSPHSHPSFDDAVDEVEQIFLQAVKKRLFADVRVGALLSGGVDSSLVCWAIAQLGGNVTAFTVGTPGDPFDESADARATAQELGLPHRVLEISGEEPPEIDELITAYSEPFACASALGMLRVSRAVVSEATVLLTGDGGDDVFLGYPEHRHLWFAQRSAGRVPRWLSPAWLASRELVPRRGLLKRAGSFLDYMSGGLGAVACAHDGLPTYAKYGLTGERLVDTTLKQRQIPWTQSSARRVLSDFLDYDRATRFVGEYMTKVDGATMHYALEARAPFLDQELWEFAASLPFDLRFYQGRLKAVLRELANRRLGPRVSGGGKRGFTIPVQRWLAGRWRVALEKLLHESELDKQGWIRAVPALDLLDKSSKKGWVPNQLWYIFVLESWLRHEKNQMGNAVAKQVERVSIAS
jgi:asparagine synthase (glutamine-hydrolysing)